MTPFPTQQERFPRLWYAVSVKPQHEKKAACVLRNQGLEDFLPLYRSRRRWSDRIKELDLPLFPGYVFCRFGYESRLRVLSVPGVTAIVGIGKRPAAVTDGEIDSIRAMISSGLPLEPWPFLKAGQPIHIDYGPLAGLDGVLAQVKDSWRVVVNVNLLQRSVAVEVDRDMISPASRLRRPAVSALSASQVSRSILHVCAEA